jgi:ribosomal protein S18 acetylase RimI-like enzyme
VLGRHVHLVACSAIRGDVRGQVEGWLERHGVDEATPNTCEVRSLIVQSHARGTGAGRALLDALAQLALTLGRGTPAVLVAEVLDPNPARAFYERLGYRPISYSARIPSAAADRADAEGRSWGAMTARVAEPRDALAVAVLDGQLASRRRAAGDVRFDRPRAVDATVVSAIAAHLGRGLAGPLEPAELVAIDPRGAVRACATLAFSTLDPPFLPAKRAILGRFAVDPAGDPRALVPPLLALACRLAAPRGAPTIELTDLSAPGTPLYTAALASGAAPWSRLVSRFVPRG